MKIDDLLAVFSGVIAALAYRYKINKGKNQQNEKD
jgi:hypothetical protein